MIRAMIELRLEPQVLVDLARIWPNPETGKPGISAYALSKKTGVNQQTLLNYMNSTPEDFNPSWRKVQELEDYFDGLVTFCVDIKKGLNNEKSLKTLEDFFKNSVYKKSSR